MREHYAINRRRLRAKKFANMRAAKERKRMDRAFGEPPDVDVSCAYFPPFKPSGFRVTIQCLDDGERVSFTALRTPFGLSVSPTLAGRKVAAVLANYVPRQADPDATHRVFLDATPNRA